MEESKLEKPLVKVSNRKDYYAKYHAAHRDKYNAHSRAYAAEARTTALQKRIHELQARLAVPNSVLQSVLRLYEASKDLKEFKGRKNEKILMACFASACRESNIPRTLKELGAAFDVKPGEVNRQLGLLTAAKLHKEKRSYVELRLKQKAEQDVKDKTEILSQMRLQLGLREEMTVVADSISNRASDIMHGEVGSISPKSIALAALLLLMTVSPYATDKRRLVDINRVVSTSFGKQGCNAIPCYHRLFQRRLDLVPLSFASEAVVEHSELLFF